MKFRKKPVEIDALQWTGNNKLPLSFFCGDAMWDAEGLLIDTLEGRLRANIGDWIIKGVAGEFYACKPDIFQATYEPVSSSDEVAAPPK